MKRARNQAAPSVRSKRVAEVVFSQAAAAQHVSQPVGINQNQAATSEQLSPEQQMLPLGEDVSRYCPVCSQRLESRRCKLICPECGYYMSCADYY